MLQYLYICNVIAVIASFFQDIWQIFLISPFISFSVVTNAAKKNIGRIFVNENIGEAYKSRLGLIKSAAVLQVQQMFKKHKKALNSGFIKKENII